MVLQALEGLSDRDDPTAAQPHRLGRSPVACTDDAGFDFTNPHVLEKLAMAIGATELNSTR